MCSAHTHALRNCVGLLRAPGFDRAACTAARAPGAQPVVPDLDSHRDSDHTRAAGLRTQHAGSP